MGGKHMGFFSDIKKVEYEGPNSKNPLSFKYYNPEGIILGKKMKDHLKFAVSYWHTFKAIGDDQFGEGTITRQWDEGSDLVSNAKECVKAAFEFMEKLGIDYFCFHDRDIAPEGKNLKETNEILDEIVDL